MAYHHTLILLILLVILQPTQILCDKNCSRAISRKVSHAIGQLLKDERGISKHLLPECALDQRVHIFNHEESINTIYPTGERQCGFCGEIFQNEESYDRHMESLHSSLQSGEFFCPERLCAIFGKCGETARTRVCTAVLQGDVLELCRKTVWGCFSSGSAESKSIGVELGRKLCNEERILKVNRCVEEVPHDQFSGIAEFFSYHFPKVLLLFIMLSTFIVSYKVNEYVNKVK